MDLSPESIRMECLRIAAAGNEAMPVKHVVAAAETYADFVMGRLSTKDRIKAALKEAGVI